MFSSSVTVSFTIAFLYDTPTPTPTPTPTSTQRLPDVFGPHGLLPGGGICVQKVPLGVTVRHIKFIDDASVSSPQHPLYALLVSRETLCDQSHLNDDGLTSDQRRGAKEEKEREKTRRQVEADLGGFEVEQEWVEEIEREDCFEVEKKYGGAPPIPGRAYEIWVSSREFLGFG